MILDDVVEIMISLPDKLFLNTPISVCLWILSTDKTKNGRDRRKETLFIDARNLGKMISRKLRILEDTDINKISNICNSWRKGKDYKDEKGFYKSVNIDEIEKNKYALNPGNYIGFKDDGSTEEDSSKTLKELIKEFETLNSQSNELDKKIQNNFNSMKIDD